MSPTQRSLASLRADGWTVCVVEKWIPQTAAGYKGPILRSDAFGFGDLLAVKVGEPGATLVQTTSGSNMAARVNKIRENAAAAIWLAAGNKIVVHGWRKVQKNKRKVWEVREHKMEASNEF